MMTRSLGFTSLSIVSPGYVSTNIDNVAIYSSSASSL